MNLTAQEEVILRQRPHRTKLWLSIYEPKTVFACQATGTIAFGETEIDYYAVSTGSYLNTYPNMTVLIGSQAGQDDLGRVRLRAATGTYVVLAENNTIWGNGGQHLTFIDYINVEAIYPKIIKDPNNDENVIFYKDDDIPYSNQNSIYGSFPNAGSHRAAFIETGSVSLYWTATGTYNVRGDGLTYQWHFEGGNPTGSTALTPGFISYNTTGHYRTTLTVTSAAGAIDKTYRYVSLYDRPENGTNTPILKWTLNDFSENRAEGGCTANIRVWQDLGSIEPNALVILFADDWYGSSHQSLGGNGQNNQRIVFVGYILRDSIQFNYKEGWAEFDVGSISEVMKEAEGFSVSCESKQAASTWFELTEMTIAKAVYHYLRWHSTVLNVADFQYTGDDRLVQYFDSDRASLYDSIATFLSEGIFGELVTDRQGKLWAEISPVGLTDPFDDISNGLTIHKHDWIGEPNISIRRTAETSFVEMGGIVYEGVSTNGFQALLSNAPSITPLYRGKLDSPRQGLILNGQTQLNKISGNYLAQKNSKFEDVSLPLAGNYRNLGVAPQEKLYLLIDGSETQEAASLIGHPFRLMSMNWLYNPENESFYPDITLEEIVTGTAGQTVIIPPVTELDGYSFPSFELPPFPDFNTPAEPPTQKAIQLMLGIEKNYNTLFYTLDFDSTYPTYFSWRYGIDSEDYVSNPGVGDDAYQVFITPNGAVWIATWIFANGGYSAKKIYRAPYLGGKFEKIITPEWLEAQYGADSIYRTILIRGFGYNTEASEEVAFIVSFADFNSTCQMWIGNASSRESGVAFGASDTRFGKITGAEDEWVWDLIGASNEGFVLLDISGNVVQSELFGQGNYNFHSRAGKSKTILKWKEGITGTDGLLRSEDNTRETTVITVPDGIFSKEVAVAPDGQFMMAAWDTPAYKGRSSDGGYTWTALSALTPSGARTCFAYCGDSGASSKWVAGNGAIYYSDNFGNSWTQKTGNLLELFPPPSGADIIKFVPIILQAEL